MNDKQFHAWMKGLADGATNDSGAASAIWWRAQLRRRLEIEERAGRAVRIAESAAGVFAGLALLFVIAFAASAQTPAFEVASIKPNRTGEGLSSIRLTAGLVRMENVSLQKLILAAYGIADDQASKLAGPGWLANEHFDVQASFPVDRPAPEVRRMMQTLLAERFKLILHRETRQSTTYMLVVARNGAKIHAVEDGPPRTSSGPGRLEATKISLQKLADLLARLTGQPVTEGTGLKGVYDFTLTWSPLDGTTIGAPDTNGGGMEGPSLFTALQEQLGLRLEGRQGPVEILVVDHLEKTPTEN